MFHLLRKWWRKYRDILVVFLGIAFWATITAIALFFYLAHLLDLTTILEILAAFVLAALPIYFYLLEKKEQILIIGFTSKYLIEKDESKLDDLLGILIAGRWKRFAIDPIEEFFGSLEDLCLKGDYEIRRRIAEALPALFKLDLEQAKSLVEILRHDWDEEKWRADNRRRAIEALSHILKKEKRFVSHIIRLVDKDEIYTVIAIVELIDAWREMISKKEGENLFNVLMEDMKKRQYSDSEISALVEFWGFLSLTHSDINLAYERFQTLALTSNMYLQVCLARNLKRLCPGYPKCREKHWCIGNPERIMNLMAFFLQGDKNKHVRRPIAKEETLECLLILLRYKRYSTKAKEIIWTLINDKDDIIRVTAFDRIENILETDPSFGMQIIQHVVATDHHARLVERAKVLQARILQGSPQ